MKRFRRGRKPVAVPDAELAVLKVLWKQGAANIRTITDVLYPNGQTSHYATVQKLLERLEGKACVRRRLRGRSNVYTASIGREDLIAHRLKETADKLCEGSLTPLLSQLVNTTKLSPQDLEALRDLVEQQEGRGTKRRGRGS